MVMLTATTPFRAVSVQTGIHVGNYPLSQLANRENWAGWGYLFSDFYQTGAVARPVVEMAARTVARSVRQGCLLEAERARRAIENDLLQPRRLQEVRFSSDTTNLLADLRKRFGVSYGTESVEAALDRLVAVGPEWGPFFTSAQLLIDRIVDRPYRTRANMFQTLQKIVEGHRSGLSPEFLGELLTFFHAKLGEKGRLSDIVTSAIEREGSHLALLGKATAKTTAKTEGQPTENPLEVLSRAAGATITSEELDRAVKVFFRVETQNSRRKYQLIAVRTHGADTFIRLQFRSFKPGLATTQTATFRAVFSRGRRLDHSSREMVPFVALQLVPEQASGSTAGLDATGHMLPDLDQLDRMSGGRG